jgi:hypothetical protein
MIPATPRGIYSSPEMRGPRHIVRGAEHGSAKSKAAAWLPHSKTHSGHWERLGLR